VTLKEFREAALPETYHVILDEYQNVFFNKSLLEVLALLHKAASFTGLSGSPINESQRRLLELSFYPN
jgi:hypothetical protein